MPPRLAHKKSRTGCQRCKARRIKCDELRPECRNCLKHSVSCTYVVPPHRSQDADTSQQCSPSALGISSPYGDPGDIEVLLGASERRQLELRLLYHFMTVVVYTFPACDEQRFRQLWIVDTIRIAFEQSFLFNAIMAISALHLVSDTRPVPYFYATDQDRMATERVAEGFSTANFEINLPHAHRIYLCEAVHQQREAISTLSVANADAVFMASLLLAYQSLNLIPDETVSPYSPPIQWLRMCKAVEAIIDAARPMLQNHSITALMLANTEEPDFKDYDAMFNPLHRKPFEALLDWDNYPEPDLDWDAKKAYEETLAYVGGVYQALLNRETPRAMVRRLVCLGVLAPTRYVSCVEKGRPRALVILAHHFALTKAVEEHWWFHGVGDRVVNGVKSILPTEWQWAMKWPLSMIA